MKTKHGEFICLFWDGCADAYYVRGHIDPEIARETVLEEACLDDGDDLGDAQHVYARWSMQGDAPEGCSCVLREYKKPGKGRFKVTAFNTGIFAKQE